MVAFNAKDVFQLLQKKYKIYFLLSNQPFVATLLLLRILRWVYQTAELYSE